MADKEYKTQGESLLRRLIGRQRIVSRRMSIPPDKLVVTLPLKEAEKFISHRKRWSVRAKQLHRMADQLNEMLYDPNVLWESKQRRLKLLVNDIYSVINSIEQAK